MNMRFDSGHHSIRHLMHALFTIALAVFLVACGGTSNRDKQAEEATTSTQAVLTVSGPALFNTIAYGNTISDVDETTYSKMFAVYVTDANGHAVPNQVLTLSVLPETYFKGAMTYNVGAALWQPIYSVPAGCPNEDINKNGILDPAADANGNGKIDPGNAVIVAPGVVTTESDGRITFTLQYGKRFATWVRVRLTARGTVAGTESSQSVLLTLPISISDIGDSTVPPAGATSPFGSASPCSNPN